VIDEPRVLQHDGRHLAELFGTARDAGLGLVVADQGIAGLVAVHPDLPNAVLRSTGWQLVLRQGEPEDAGKMSALFGTTWRRDVSHGSDGRSSTRWQEGPRVHPSWLLKLPTGSGWPRVAPTTPTAGERAERIVVALPARTRRPALLALPPGASSASSADGEQRITAEGAVAEDERTAVLALLWKPDAEGCRRWRGSYDDDGYPRVWCRGKYEPTHRLLYRSKHGRVPARHEVHPECGNRWCAEVEHLEALPKGEHARREAARYEIAPGPGCEQVGPDMNVVLERSDDTNEATWMLRVGEGL
jgi:hypothetical protein